jgi:hypothetical protein
MRAGRASVDSAIKANRGDDFRPMLARIFHVLTCAVGGSFRAIAAF